MITPDWIALDWGTSNLRGWAMRGDAVLAEATSDQGMGCLARDGFEPALCRLIEGWQVSPGTPIIACGMVGSRHGWAEAPYRAVPCAPVDGTWTRVQGRRHTAYILPGLNQQTPADVMRGEETQIAGFLAQHPSWDGVICLPGTHTKWAQISAGEVVSFQTYMTGEMFALLSTRSVLSHSTKGNDWDTAAFDMAVTDALARPEKTAAHLFSIRATDLLQGSAPGTGRARLSGLLIGAELAAARPYWLGTRIALIGGETLSAAYARALSAQGASASTHSATEMTLAGLSSAYRALIEQETA